MTLTPVYYGPVDPIPIWRRAREACIILYPYVYRTSIIQISHFPMADLVLSGHNWASAPTPARGRELRRPGATDISMCFILFHDIFNYINYT